MFVLSAPCVPGGLGRICKRYHAMSTTTAVTARGQLGALMSTALPWAHSGVHPQTRRNNVRPARNAGMACCPQNAPSFPSTSSLFTLRTPCYREGALYAPAALGGAPLLKHPERDEPAQTPEPSEINENAQNGVRCSVTDTAPQKTPHPLCSKRVVGRSIRRSRWSLRCLSAPRSA